MTMTPQEIDALEFKQESQRARERAMDYTLQKQAEEKAKALGVKLNEPEFLTLFKRMERDRRFRSERRKHERRTRVQHSKQSSPISCNGVSQQAMASKHKLKAREAGVRVDPTGGRRKLYQFKGKWCTIEELAEISSVCIDTLRHRLRYGSMSIERAVTDPVHPTRKPQPGPG